VTIKPPSGSATIASDEIRIGTRGSELALRQAGIVQSGLAAFGLASRLVTFTTTGDRMPDVALSAIGAKGLFTKELEDDLLNGRIDCAVHSLKDLPTDAPPGLVIAAVLTREDPRDVLVVPSSHTPGAGSHLSTLPAGARIGTSSLRRRAQLRAARPDLEIVELRGNVPTRVRKVDAGVVDGAILAAAGLHRLGLAHRVSAYLEPPEWLPAPGQGAIAVQVRADDAAMRASLGSLGDKATWTAVSAERALLAALDGGCQVPIGALVVRDGAALTLHAFLADANGDRAVRGSIAVDEAHPAASGIALAGELRSSGGTAILASLRALERVPVPQPE
jgi:hydroxymethylbilane synthase